ncbi:MAG TPA: aminomethyl-transferring glycine dehydrogenase [Thermoanaerobaculia bacterium]|nr:aminomethyl-transferring glycine dehydrogenase [Thermoanaerobaculia bacterium]
MTNVAVSTPAQPRSASPRQAGFVDRHIGPTPEEIGQMLDALGVASLDALVDQTVPASIRYRGELRLGDGETEEDALERLRALVSENRVLRSCIGMGYHGCVVPGVIQRNVLENPAWYTAYTPYQAEIAQGRLEALLNFQTLVTDLTGLPVANASLLDEATAAAEAMAICLASARGARTRFLVADGVHPQTLEVVETRAWALGVEVVTGDHRTFEPDDTCCGVLLQYPTTTGSIYDYEPLIERVHRAEALAVVAADPLALVLLRPPGEMGADIAVGSTQRFGVPMGFGGPHAAYMATQDALKRRLPGRVVGVSRDARGRTAYRLALQTREQHIRREKATSNICTAQVLPAVMASMYAVYHGADGLERIARRVHGRALRLAESLAEQGHCLPEEPFFDTLRVEPAAGRGAEGLDGPDATEIVRRAREHGYNLRPLGARALGITLDETTREEDVDALIEIFAGAGASSPGDPDSERNLRGGTAVRPSPVPEVGAPHARTSRFLEHPVFYRHRSETAMLRYLHGLAAKDLSLTTSMIPLGSCTMKLNATAEMVPVTWPEVSALHPFAPADQTGGYRRLIAELEQMLGELTGFPAVSLQPNAGSQGELTGLLMIRRYLEARGEPERRACLIPESAHGTNPASAVMAGYEVVVVGCDEQGNIDLADLEAKLDQHAERLAALMVTYPSTHGVFEESIVRICELVHSRRGQVYMDGANFNAMVGLCRPGDFGVDVCHLNLHKTFCIPHGGGGPGMGPVAAAAHLAPHLPGHRVIGLGGPQSMGAVAAAPWGSPSILPISWMYIKMMGGPGLRRASQVAILNANYVAARLENTFPVLFRGRGGRVAHECILDLRPLKRQAGVEVEDVAKRLIDYGFHAPTVSWPVPGTVMVEPTESESKEELDRFCAALDGIRDEARAIERGELPVDASALRNAPHPAEDLLASPWERPYTREAAAYPASWTRERKYWPPVARIDNAWGDRNLVCTCPPVADYTPD